MAAPGRWTTLALGIVAGLLTITRSAATSEAQTGNVWITDKFKLLFVELVSQGCLPSNYDASFPDEIGEKCFQKVTANDSYMPDCGEAPIIARYYNCLSNGLGTTNAEGTCFDITAFDASIERISADGNWINMAKITSANCYDVSAADLMPRQLAIFVYTCWRWTLVFDCDALQARSGALSDAALLRRAHFLSGSCPFSPIPLLDSFGVVTGRTLAECSTPLDTGADAQQTYDAAISRVVRLLQNFTTAAGNVDFPRLYDAISNVVGRYDTGTVHGLQAILQHCSKQGVLPEKLVKCWANFGVPSCIIMEADQVARQLPQTCAIFV